jgi:hypothetical protein
MTVLAVEGYEPEGLGPLDYELLRLVPFNVGERVAFPDIDPGPGNPAQHEHAGRYGVIKAIGYADGGIRLDLLVFDPNAGVQDADSIIYRATMGELQ